MPAEIARGIQDVKVYVLTGETPGSAVDFPGVQALEWSVESDSEELRGDNEVIAVVRSAKTVTGTLRGARMNLAATAALVGGTVATSGVTPDEITSLEESSAAANRYVQIVGQTPGVDGGAYRVTIYKALVTGGPNESLSEGEWNTPEFEFSAVALDSSGMVLKREQFETEELIEAP